ncbi:HCL043Cp [Eremothecium sinecaudum]|uniref:HCL043Cp n=1 Tax=Eremothecium sinecaudum TaxID=45286 RepID=A0A0X8HRH8_9SACH|nr:HCL043Cp [Eremothecium sinecaudum]AMD20108.1 HCL043Cp [Eremothecium sinecaudum]
MFGLRSLNKTLPFKSYLSKGPRIKQRLNNVIRLQLPNNSKVLAKPSKKHNGRIKRATEFKSSKKLQSSGRSFDDNFERLKETKSKDYIYTALGVSGNQLKDSKLVALDVMKLCKKKELHKALMLTKLANRRGAVAMNYLMEFYMRQLQDGKSAIDLYNYRKKWGIPITDATNTILFSGLAKLQRPLSKALTNTVFEIIKGLITTSQMNIITLNAAFNCLLNSSNPEYVFKALKLKSSNLVLDEISYEMLLRAALFIRNDFEAIDQANAVIKSVPKELVTNRILFHYINVWNMRDNPDLSRTALNLIHRFYNCGGLNRPPKAPAIARIPNFEEWSIRSKLSLDDHICALMLENYFKRKLWNKVDEHFNYLRDQDPSCLNEKAYLYAIKVRAIEKPATCIPYSLELYRELHIKQKAVSKSVLLAVYESMARQLEKKSIQNNKTNLNTTLKTIHSFVTQYDSLKINGTVVLNIRSWYAYLKLLSYFKKSKADLIHPERLEAIVTLFISSFENSALNLQLSNKELKNSASYTTFVYREIIRFCENFTKNARPDSTSRILEFKSMLQEQHRKLRLEI